MDALSVGMTVIVSHGPAVGRGGKIVGRSFDTGAVLVRLSGEPARLLELAAGRVRPVGVPAVRRS